MSHADVLACRSCMRVVLLCLVLTSCADRFAECEQPLGRDDYCPGMRRETCRLEVLRRDHANGCVEDADCALADYADNCIAHGLCEPRPAVLASSKRDYEAASAKELSDFCAPMSCRLGGSCGDLDTRAACVEGACTTLIR